MRGTLLALILAVLIPGLHMQGSFASCPPINANEVQEVSGDGCSGSGSTCIVTCKKGWIMWNGGGRNWTKLECFNGEWNKQPNCYVDNCEKIGAVSNETWTEYCQNLNRRCHDRGSVATCEDCMEGFKPGVKDLACVPKTCDDLKCDERQGMECVVDAESGARCVCKIGFKSNGYDCRIQNCGDVNSDKGRTWKDLCEDRMNTQCQDSHNAVPECVCKEGFKPTEDGDCEAKSCDDLQCRMNMECVSDAESNARCVCKSGFKLHEGLFCVGQDCDDVNSEKGRTWKDFCEDRVNMRCQDSLHHAPWCVCKEGFEHKDGYCKEMSCKDVNLPGAELRGKCVSARIDDWCQIECKSGLQLRRNGTLVESLAIVCEKGYHLFPDHWFASWNASLNTLECTGTIVTTTERETSITTERGQYYCSSLNAPSGGEMAGDCRGDVAGGKCLFACPLGRRILGHSILTCQHNGQWNLDVPTCSAQNCQSVMDTERTDTWESFCERQNKPCTLDPHVGPKCGCQEGLEEMSVCVKKRKVLQNFLNLVIDGKTNRR